MNGIICCSSESGILVFAESYKENFGFCALGSDPMQLASTLFALYQTSTLGCASQSESVPDASQEYVSFHSQGDCTTTFLARNGLLVILSIDSLFCRDFSKSISSKFLEALSIIDPHHQSSTRNTTQKSISISLRSIYEECTTHLLGEFDRIRSSVMLDVGDYVMVDIRRPAVEALSTFVTRESSTGAASPHFANDLTWWQMFGTCWERLWHHSSANTHASKLGTGNDEVGRGSIRLRADEDVSFGAIYGSNDCDDEFRDVLFNFLLFLQHSSLDFSDLSDISILRPFPLHSLDQQLANINGVIVHNVALIWRENMLGHDRNASLQRSALAGNALIELSNSSKVFNKGLLRLCAWAKFCFERGLYRVSKKNQ